MSKKRKSIENDDGFDKDAREDAEIDNIVRETKQDREEYKQRLKQYNAANQLYRSQIEDWEMKKEEGRAGFYDKPEKPQILEEGKPVLKKPKREIKEKMTDREAAFKFAEGRDGGLQHMKDLSLLCKVLGEYLLFDPPLKFSLYENHDLQSNAIIFDPHLYGVKFRRKDNNPDLIDIIIPKEWLGEEHSLKLNEMEVDSSFAKKVIKSEGSSSKRKPEKTVEVKKEENKPEPTMDWTSSHKGNGKGKAKEENQHLLSAAIKVEDSDSDEDLIVEPLGPISKQKEDSDSEDDDSFEEPEPVILSSFGVKKKFVKVKKEVEVEEDSEDDGSFEEPDPVDLSDVRIKNEVKENDSFGQLDPVAFSRSGVKKEVEMEEDSQSDDDAFLEVDPIGPIKWKREEEKLEEEQEETKEEDDLEKEAESKMIDVSKLATVSAADRSLHEHKPSWPCTPDQASAEPLPLDSEHSIPAPILRFLRDYQIEGAKFLFQNWSRGWGGLLGDDMGTGKTVQTIAFLCAMMKQTGFAKDDENKRRKDCWERRKILKKTRINPLDIGPTCLLIVPATVIQNWEREIRTWCYLSFVTFGPQNIDGLLAYKSGKFDILIVSHEYARDKIDELTSPSTKFSCIVIDEAHKFKNPKSVLTQSYHKFDVMIPRFGLSGTVVQNDFSELWCLLDLLNPRKYGDGVKSWEFLVSDIIKIGMDNRSTSKDRDNKAIIIDAVRTKLLSQVYLRRTKAILKDSLPKKFYHVIFCQMTPLQDKAYSAALKDCENNSYCPCGARYPLTNQRKLYKLCHGLGDDGLGLTEEAAKNRHWFIYYHILNALANHVGLLLPDKRLKDSPDPLARLRYKKQLTYLEIIFKKQNLAQMTLNLRQNSAAYCGKWRTLVNLLRKFKADGDKVLLFSSRNGPLQYIHEYCEMEGYNNMTLQGTTPANQRLGLCDQFNDDPTAFLFLIATKAGGTGLNLTGANRVIIFDPSSNPAHDNQAIDRAFRMGQKRDVEVYRLLSDDSIEATTYQRQVYKEQLSEGILEGRVFVPFWEGVKGKKELYGKQLWGKDNLMSRPEASTKSITNKGRHLEVIKEMGVFIDDFEKNTIIDESDEEQDEGLLIKKQGGKKDDLLERSGVQDHQDHRALMTGTEAVDISSMKKIVLERWNAPDGFAKSDDRTMKSPKLEKEVSAESSTGKSKSKSKSSKTQASRASQGISTSSKLVPQPRGGWKPPARRLPSSTNQQDPTSSTSAAETHLELSKFLQVQQHGKHTAEELRTYMAEKEGVDGPTLDFHLSTMEAHEKDKIFRKYSKSLLEQKAREADRLPSRSNYESDEDEMD